MAYFSRYGVLARSANDTHDASRGEGRVRAPWPVHPHPQCPCTSLRRRSPFHDRVSFLDGVIFKVKSSRFRYPKPGTLLTSRVCSSQLLEVHLQASYSLIKFEANKFSLPRAALVSSRVFFQQRDHSLSAPVDTKPLRMQTFPQLGHTHEVYVAVRATFPLLRMRHSGKHIHYHCPR